LPELRRTESKNISSNPLQQSIADVGSEPVLDLDKDHVDREVQEDGEVGMYMININAKVCKSDG